MENESLFSELLAFFKALADETRLKIVGVLARTPASGEDLAHILALNPATVSRHVSRLHDAGLIAVQPKGHYYVYSLNLATLHDMARRLLASDALPLAVEGLVPDLPAASGADPYDRKVLRDF